MRSHKACWLCVIVGRPATVHIVQPFLNLTNMKKNILLWALSIAITALQAQDEGLRFYDYVYLNNIKSVKLHVQGLLLSQPIMNLNTPAGLKLSFDDMDGDTKRYVYTVVHCDANWEPSKLTEAEYINGFQEGDIETFDYSFKTRSIYTHYWFSFPNRDMELTQSGNYLLKVYENEGEKRLAITRRFMVVDNKVSVIPTMVRPADVGKNDTHQEIDFTVTHKDFEIRNPRTELSVTVLQNGRWDNAITGLQPQFSKLDEQVYDFQDKIVFPAGREFRYADLRSTKVPSGNVEFIDFENEHPVVTLYPDRKRIDSGHLEIDDLNGNYVIQTLDDDDHDLESDYVTVWFKLYSPMEMYQQDLYIFGGLTDWQLKPEFKMVYNPAISSYVGRAELKQGYYDYLYAALPKGASAPEFDETEGNWFETDNLYTVLVYYRPFGGRADQLIGAYSFNSRR